MTTEVVHPKENLVIVGAGEFAEIAYNYFSRWTNFNVVAFSAEKKYITRDALFNKPVVAFEELTKLYPPAEYKLFVAVTYTQLNRIRTKLYNATKANGYSFASFIHPTVFKDETAEIGENCFIFELNNIQYNARVGDNVILWSKNHIGHRAIIKNNCFLSTGVTVSGYCEIGENCFLGVNSCVADYVKIPKDCIIGAGSVVLKNLEQGKVYVGNPAKPLTKTSYEAFKVMEI